MKKRGSILKVLGIIFLVFFFVVIFGIYYLYNFYVFKEIRLCVGEAENSQISCSSSQDCISQINLESNRENIKKLPGFAKEKFQEILNYSVYCENSCFIRKIRGVNIETQQIENLDLCNLGEKEFIIKIHGKEGLEILSFSRSEMGSGRNA